MFLVCYNTIKKLLREYSNKGFAQSEKLLIEIVPNLFETEDIRIGIESFKKEGPGKATFKGK